MYGLYTIDICIFHDFHENKNAVPAQGWNGAARL
jgi:hypothetical protein